MMNKVKVFIKKEIVLCIAALLAVLSVLAVPVSAAYMEYIDFRTLSLLFCLMTVVAGWQKAGVFDVIATGILKGIRSLRPLVMVLVLLCFFSSMVITNDVALITFVPFTILLLKRAEQEKWIIFTVVMQTIGANLGSMLLPVGNPQNLYLYGVSEMSFGAFAGMMFPLWLLSLVLIMGAFLFVKNERIALTAISEKNKEYKKKDSILYLILFLVCLATVARWIPYEAALVLVAAEVLIIDRRLLKEVDYMLLLTFVCFFVFIGNVKAIPQLTAHLTNIIAGNELFAGILSSQVISNVPAAILLSGFTTQIRFLCYGVNIGGLGTLIASLASLISYKLYIKENTGDGKKYFLVFTVLNGAYLLVLAIAGYLLTKM